MFSLISITAANASGYLQSHRWGDAPVQSYAIRLFMEPSSIFKLWNVEYIHGSHRMRLRNGTFDHVRGIVSTVLYGNYSTDSK